MSTGTNTGTNTKRGTGLVALVTGASSGIGRAIAVQLAADGFELVVVARRRALLDTLAQQVHEQHGGRVHVVEADLVQPDAPVQVHAATTQLGLQIDVLVNNAGLGSVAEFTSVSSERLLQIVDINCRTLLHLTRLYLPQMRARRRGFVLNVASVAGFMPGPRSATYYASKAFVVSLSQGLAHEVQGDNVVVTCTCPGPVATEFQRRSGVQTVMGGAAELSEDDVAAISLRALWRGQRVVVPGRVNALLVFLTRLLPRAWQAAVVEGIQKKRAPLPGVPPGEGP